MMLSLRNKSINQDLNKGIIAGIGFVFLFFSIIVKTKIDSFLFFIVPLALLYISITLNYIIEYSSKKIKPSYLTPAIFIIVAIVSINPKWINNYFSSNNLERSIRIYNANVYKELNKIIPDNIHVVMNMSSFEDIDVMFYNRGITAYHWTLPEEDFKSFEERKIPIAVFEPHGNYNLPDHVLKYPYLYIIKKNLIDFQ